MPSIPALLKRGPAPAWAMLGLWLVSAAYLAAIGRADILAIRALVGGYELLLAVIVVFVTRPLPTRTSTLAAISRTRTWMQLVVVIGFIVLAGFASNLPVWSDVTSALAALGERLLPAEIVGGPGNAVVNPVQYFVLPLLALLALGARPAELGLGRGHKVLRACLVWLAAPMVFWFILFIGGQLTWMRLLRAVVSNALQNGFFEEFLFRGVLQTRLNRLTTIGWALVLQALIFGVWHLDANSGVAAGDPLAALAACVVGQAVGGLAYGIVFLRTRNLIAPSVAHVVMNAVGRTM